MSSGDFASELDQSVQMHLDEIRLQVVQAKARIGQSVAAHAPAPRAAVPDFDDEPVPQRRMAAVAFDDVPVFDEAPVNFNAVEDDAIFLDPPSGGAHVDDEGIPVWEDIP